MIVNISEKSNFIWKIADILRGDYKQSEYGDVILPFTVLCRLDSVLAPTKDAVLDVDRTCKYKNKAPFLKRATQTPSTPGGYNFWNTSEFTFAKLKGDPDNIADNLRDYIKGFSENARTILESFDIYSQIARLDKANLLWLVVCKFADDIDLHPDMVSNNEMGYIFEELIRKFSEMSNETAGEHFTPREVIRLMVSILFCPDMEKIKDSGYMAKLYDPAAGTGGMLSAGIEYASELNDRAIIEVYGQELNEKTYAICKSDTMIKGKGYENIHLGNSFTDDALPHETFHYMLCNPPFGVEWKKYEKFIRDENENKGYAGRFGAGLPRVSDGSLLFLQHMISKMMAVEDGGCRIGIVFNGSPLFTGDAGSGESEIRKWIIENGWLETIVAMPDQLFYNTGILTYVWIVTNRKKGIRKGKIQLIDGTSFFERMRKPLGEKRKTLSENHIAELTRIYGDFVEGEFCKIFDEDDFAYWKVTVERPLRLNFQASPERIEGICDQTAFVNLATSRKRKPEEIAREVAEGKKQQEAIIAAVGTLDGTKLYKNRPEFTKLLQKAFKKAELDVKAPLLKAILAGLSEKDETADICTEAKGNPEPDTDLRDTEQIPFNENITSYIEREVLPYAPDAWVDESKTKKGYEIPFPRYFNSFKELGNSEDTLLEIQSSGEKIQSSINLLFDKDKSSNIDALISDLEHQAEMLEVYKRQQITDITIHGLDADVAFKDSGVSWIGKIPSDWEIVPLRAVAHENNVKNTGLVCENLLSLSYGKIVQKNIDTNTGLLPASFEGYQIIRPGYVVLRLTDLQNDKRSLRTGFAMETGIITSAYLSLVLHDERILPKYFAYLLHAYDLKKIFYTLGGGVRQTLKYSDFKSLPILVPPKDVQEKIVDYIEAKISWEG